MMKLVISVLLSLCALLPADFARADSQLYGLTRVGQLVAIDKTTGAGTLVLTLPSQYANFRGVEYASGYFYASYNGGYVLRFNLSGAVTVLGYSGYPFVDELSARPDGRVFAVLSQNDESYRRYPNYNNDGRCESLGELNLTTGLVSVAAAPPQANVDGVGLSFKALVYLDNTNFYASTASGGMGERPQGYLDPLTASSPYFINGSSPPGASVSWGILTGLAKDQVTGVIYGVDGYEPPSASQAYAVIPSTLYQISYQTPSLPEQPIGATGFSGIVGLTFGPDWHPLPSSTTWEPIQMLLNH